jgi:hypothetical protein
VQTAQIDPHQINVPGRHEAEMLADMCQADECLRVVRPAAVVDQVMRGRIVGRIAAYRCPACDAAWLCWWGAPGKVSRASFADGFAP